MKLKPIEKSIIKGAAAGNLADFEKLVNYYEKPVFYFTFRYIQNRADAEDITQEVFLKVFRSLSRFDQEKSFSTWVFTIAQNTTFDWLRKRRRNKEILIIDDPDYSSETFLPHKNETRRHNAAIDLSLAFKKIKPVYQSVTHLFYRDGLEYREIADKLNLPLNTVKTYLYRAKKTLRKSLS